MRLIEKQFSHGAQKNVTENETAPSLRQRFPPCLTTVKDALSKVTVTQSSSLTCQMRNRKNAHYCRRAATGSSIFQECSECGCSAAEICWEGNGKEQVDRLRRTV